MKTKKALFLVVLFCVFFISACEENIPEFTQILEVSTQPVSGSSVRLLSITSSKHYLNQKQNEVRPKLKVIINGGEHNITSVKTLYSSGYLTAAEVTYDASSRGDGNNMRVMFIHSNKNYWNQRAADIKPRLDKVINSGKYNIVKINTTYAQGYLLAAEVYYREKSK